MIGLTVIFFFVGMAGEVLLVRWADCAVYDMSREITVGLWYPYQISSMTHTPNSKLCGGWNPEVGVGTWYCNNLLILPLEVELGLQPTPQPTSASLPLQPDATRCNFRFMPMTSGLLPGAFWSMGKPMEWRVGLPKPQHHSKTPLEFMGSNQNVASGHISEAFWGVQICRYQACDEKGPLCMGFWVDSDWYLVPVEKDAAGKMSTPTFYILFASFLSSSLLNRPRFLLVLCWGPPVPSLYETNWEGTKAIKKQHSGKDP